MYASGYSSFRLDQRDALNAALAKIDRPSGFVRVYRRIDVADINTALSPFAVAHIVRAEAFQSASVRALDQFGQDIEFVIDSVSAVSVRALSIARHQNEWLVPAGREFEVVKIEEHRKPPRVTLREIGPTGTKAVELNEMPGSRPMTDEEADDLIGRMTSAGLGEITKRRSTHLD